MTESDPLDPRPTVQLPAIISPGVPTSPIDAYAATLVPALIADAGDAAGWRYVEFFTANICNPNTRRAYARACGRFFIWCEDRGLTLTTIRPFDVATYIKDLQETHSAPAVKQQLAAVRMLFDWLITGQIVPINPAAAVRGPKHVVKTGKTPVLDGKEWRHLIDTIPTETVRDLRDRALIATLTYGFARVGAALKMRVEDLRARSPPASWHRSATIVFARPGSRPISPNGGALEHAQAMAAHEVRAQPSSMIAPRSGSRSMRWSASGSNALKR